MFLQKKIFLVVTVLLLCLSNKSFCGYLRHENDPNTMVIWRTNHDLTQDSLYNAAGNPINKT